MDIPFEYKSFEYDALTSPTCIRLLWPIKRFQDAEHHSINGVPLMEFLLETSEHDRRPPYQALSYTWGNPKEAQIEQSDQYSMQHKYAIAVNGRLFYVGKNLYEALYRIQERMVRPNNIDDRCCPFNKTQLIQAAEEGNLQQVKECLDLGADHQCQDNFGETALHYAAENGCPVIARLLLRRGANRTIRDSTGRDPLGCCLQRKRRQWHETAQILRTWDKQDKDRSNPTKPKTLTGQPFWIDAICINQDDIQERNSQVAMMSQIYGSAHSVLAWLGEEDDTTQVACRFLLSEMASPEEYKSSFRRWVAYRRGDKLDLDEKPDGIVMSVRELLAIKCLVTRPWFSRTWVIQEVSLAKQIDMMCGPFQFSWVKLFELIFSRFGDLRTSMILSYGGPAIKFGRAVPGTEILSLFEIRIRTRPNCKEAKARREWLGERPTSQQLSLPALIVLSWNFGVSDPRDRIFALLGISQPLKGMWADYSKSVTEVFTDMAKILIQAKGDVSVQNWTQTEMDELEPLESLSFVQPPSSFLYQSTTISLNNPEHGRPTTMPSWVPMFNLQLVSWRIYDKKYNASRDRQANFHPSIPGILKLDGLVVDSIVELEEPPLWTFCERLIDDNAVEKWLGIVSRLSVIYPTGESRVEALWRTIVQEKQDYEKSEASKTWFKGEAYVHGMMFGETLKGQEDSFYTIKIKTISNLSIFPSISNIITTVLDIAANGGIVKPPDDAVLVVGAGPVCSMTAAVVAHYWLKVVIVERNKEPTRTPILDISCSEIDSSGDTVHNVPGGAHGPFEIQIDKILVRSAYRPSTTVAKSISGPQLRVFLAGDATHQNMATGGYSMNTGIGDAHDID
ncbi:heterokaryon incompatibility 6 OR allele [Fusarium pseudocircinatum]|uniref:Heterokaryon incompatibility 6 OR allele n=1 Tax=Fusarium pseudocircinatum TaxID=56676 RepID=A0A8H5KPV4_9HYPO|nr:heterokaryon incompatibility 6 OR allele [Fusarium pseudocircinatum]